ncbi:hypothetical protein D3C81_2068780 [compost metagenome]
MNMYAWINRVIAKNVIAMVGSKLLLTSKAGSGSFLSFQVRLMPASSAMVQAV